MLYSKTIFLARLELLALLCVWRAFPKAESLIYFEGTTSFVSTLLLRMLGMRARKATISFGDATSKDAGFSTIDFMTRAFEVTREASENLLLHSPLLKPIASRFPIPEKFFLNQLTMRNFFCHREWRRIRIIDEYSDQLSLADRHLVIPSTPYIEIVAALERETGVSFTTYYRPDLSLPRKAMRMGFKLTARFIKAILSIFKDTSQKQSAKQAPPTGDRAQPAPGPAVCRIFTGKRINTLDFDRNEFFGFSPTENPFSRYIVYGKGTQNIHAEDASIFSANNIEIIGSGPHCARWKRSSTTFTAMGRCLLSMLKGLAASFGSWDRYTVYHLAEAFEVFVQYSTFLDFLQQNDIRTVIVENNPTSGVACALDDGHCIGIMYQTSISHIGYPYYFYRSGMDIHFTFSSLYAQKLEKLELPSTRVVPVGYVYDEVMTNAPLPIAIKNLESELKDRGAKHIVVWFLENAMSHWASQITPERQIELFSEVISAFPKDHYLVLKPKHMVKFGQEILSQPMMQALIREYPHLIVPDVQDDKFDTYPFHYGRIADVCIGDLIGGTAAMEAVMAGCPAHLLDHCNMSQGYPIKDIDRYAFVHNDCASLAQAVTAHPDSHKAAMRDWKAFIDIQVAPNDGHACERIMECTHSIIDEFGRSKEKSSVLSKAMARLEQRWGMANNTENLDIA